MAEEYNAYKHIIVNKPNLEYITLQDNFDVWRNKINLSISKVRSVEEFPAITCKMMETADNYLLDTINYSFVTDEDGEVERDAAGNVKKIITEPKMAWVSMGDLLTEYGVIFNGGNDDVVFNANLTVKGNLFVYQNSSMPYISLYKSSDPYKSNTSLDFYSLVRNAGEDEGCTNGDYKFLKYKRNADTLEKIQVDSENSVRTSQIKESYEYTYPLSNESEIQTEIDVQKALSKDFSQSLKEKKMLTGYLNISTADNLILDAGKQNDLVSPIVNVNDIYFYNKSMYCGETYESGKSNTQLVIPESYKVELSSGYDFIVKTSISNYSRMSNIFQYTANEEEDTHYKADDIKIRKVAFSLTQSNFTGSKDGYDSTYTPFTIEEHYNATINLTDEKKRNNYSTITMGGSKTPTNLLLYGKTFISDCDITHDENIDYSDYYKEIMQNGGLKPYTKSENGIEPTLIVNGEILSTRVYNAGYNDYAEYFERGEDTEPGDIIALDEYRSYKEQYVKATSQSHCIVGVHSDTYGHIIGGVPEQLEKFIPVGLCGRVKVKVRGEVHYGDKIVPSETPGVGKAYEPGKDDPENIIGFLVESDRLTVTRKLRMKIK